MKDYDYKKIDSIFHSRIRLAAASMLYHDGRADFNTLKESIGATDGNLTTHLRRMEESGYTEVEKKFSGRKPVSIYRLTAVGRKAFENYICRLESFLQPGK
ncbi:MAG: transcriptional regulator [Spirochaetales bacterium]|nr:transcriptional regulator [Spirochaetales bacterium]